MAREKLFRLPLASVQREDRLRLANFSRRAGLYLSGLRLLAPVVSQNKTACDALATPQELSEYAVLLQRSGAIEQALGLLRSLDPIHSPDILLNQAYCLFNRWEFNDAIPILREYLTLELSKYARSVGQINLALSLVAEENFAEATSLLDSIIANVDPAAHTRLLANAFDLRGQCRILQGDLAHAGQDLERAAQLLRNDPTQNGLSIKKWQAVIAARHLGSVAPLDAFRLEAARAEDWESIRHADLHRLCVQFKAEQFQHLLFGSPFPQFRQRVQKTLDRVIIESHYIYGKPNVQILDISEGTYENRRVFQTGSQVQRVLQALLQDYYKPVLPGQLFAAVFPNEYFDPFTSPGRMHQVLLRVRKTLLTEKLPLEIQNSNGRYKIVITGALALRLPYILSPADPLQILFARLKREIGRDLFDARSAAQRLGLSISEFRRFCRVATEKRLIEKVGAGPATQYRVA